jgi:hypothetical protein
MVTADAVVSTLAGELSTPAEGATQVALATRAEAVCRVEVVTTGGGTELRVDGRPREVVVAVTMDPMAMVSILVWAAVPILCKGKAVMQVV